MEARAVLAAVIACVAALALTPLVKRLARRTGVVNEIKPRGLAERHTPLLGGLAILGGVLVAAAFTLDIDVRMRAILGGGVLIATVGAVDDVLDIHPAAKLLGQIAAAGVLVWADIFVESFTFPFLGRVDLGGVGGPLLTGLGLVVLMNVVNFSDGVDGLAAGVCAISAAAFAIIAFDLGRENAAILAAIICGACVGFLAFNFHPASVFMGDCGANLLGLLLGAVIIEGSLKTNALIALVGPLVVLAVPFLDTGFVVAKRIKYRRPIYRGDANHFHHRFSRIGFSQRRTVAYLYAWSFVMAGNAVALRFVPYSESSGRLNTGWAIVMGALLLVGVIASFYLVYVLEILKLRRLRAWQLRRSDPEATQERADDELEEELGTGEFRTLA